jgi:hypothetical protein
MSPRRCNGLVDTRLSRRRLEGVVAYCWKLLEKCGASVRHTTRVERRHNYFTGKTVIN